MNKESAFNYLRIVLISLVVALLGLGSQSHTANQHLVTAYKSIIAGDLEIASQQLAEAGEYFPWRYDLYLNAGRLAFESEDPKAAIQYLERPGTSSHLTIDDMILLGEAYEQSGDTFMAEAIWKRVTELEESTPANEHLAGLYLERRDYESAIDYLTKLLYLDPTDIQLYYQIGTLYAAIDPLKSLPFLIQAAEMDTTNSAQAKELHDRIRTANLFDEPAYTYLISGRQLANSDHWDLSAEAFRHAVELHPGYAEAWAFLGQALQEISSRETGADPDAGYAELVHALQLDPNSILANSMMGLFWERQQEYTQAQNYLELAIVGNPNDPFLYSELGNILAKAGDLPAAQAAYESAIQLSPEDPLFYRLLAEFALQHQIQIHELALPAARQAITLDPGDASSLDVMAQVMLHLQDYHSAVRFSLDAVQADPGYTQAYLHLGTAYLFLGEPGLAKQWLSQVESIDPGSWQASQAKRMLEYYFP